MAAAKSSLPKPIRDMQQAMDIASRNTFIEAFVQERINLAKQYEDGEISPEDYRYRYHETEASYLAFLAGESLRTDDLSDTRKRHEFTNLKTSLDKFLQLRQSEEPRRTENVNINIEAKTDIKTLLEQIDNRRYRDTERSLQGSLSAIPVGVRDTTREDVRLLGGDAEHQDETQDAYSAPGE